MPLVSNILESINTGWQGIVALAAAAFVGFMIHGWVDQIQRSPMVHKELIEEDNRQWEAIRGMLRVQSRLVENQTRILCELQNDEREICDERIEAPSIFELPESD